MVCVYKLLRGQCVHTTARMNKNTATACTTPAGATRTNASTGSAPSCLLHRIQLPTNFVAEVAYIVVTKMEFLITKILPKLIVTTLSTNYVARHHEVTQNKYTAIATIVLQRYLQKQTMRIMGPTPVVECK